jgi:hypothetical protein
VYAQTRYGEAQHAAQYDPQTRRANPRTVCGQKTVSAYGPAFDGTTGIQHPWKCTKCDRSIRRI